MSIRDVRREENHLFIKHYNDIERLDSNYKVILHEEGDI